MAWSISTFKGRTRLLNELLRYISGLITKPLSEFTGLAAEVNSESCLHMNRLHTRGYKNN